MSSFITTDHGAHPAEDIPRVSLTPADRIKLRERAQEEYTTKRMAGVKSILETGANSHQSSKTGKVTGFKVIVPSETIADLVIQSDDFPAARALYILDVEESQIAEYKRRVCEALENLKDDKRVYDPSICFDAHYHATRPKEAIIILGELGTSIGLYWFKKEVSEMTSRVVLALVIQSSYCSPQLRAFVRSIHSNVDESPSSIINGDGNLIDFSSGGGGARASQYFENTLSQVCGVKQVYSSEVYQESLQRGFHYRNLLAGLLHQVGMGINDKEVKPLEPHVVNPYNVIDLDSSSDSCIFYDHAFPQTSVDNGVILGHGPANGFWWLHSKEKDVQFTLKPSKLTTFPMGTRRVATVESGVSHARRGEIVCWGTIGPNPYCDRSLFEELSFSGEFYKKLGDAGLEFATTEVTQLKPLKVYVSTPPQLSPHRHYSRKHTPLRQWLKYPTDPKEQTMFIPRDHPFLLEKFMPLYNEMTDTVDIKLAQLLLAEDLNGTSYQGVFLNKQNLLALLRVAPHYKELLDTC